ncbi:Kelch repeat-containing protein [Polyangium spumosum]|uniref:Kelch-like protein n=1 Tax=Polyangium spumosum TaxID=889282 RepID=A0A6N7Q203_9BACT|nr:kelch repeat-containing protein [Polyangium spumosum]MRG98492.1 hypothetical protein [Polyangium spumosum]
MGGSTFFFRRMLYEMVVASCLLGCSGRETAETEGVYGESPSQAMNHEALAELQIRALDERFSLVAHDSRENLGHRRRPFQAAREMSLTPAGDGHFQVEVAGARLLQARVHVPVHASGEVLLEDVASGLAIRFALLESRPVQLEAARNALLFRGALGGVFDVLHVVRPDAIEDFVAFERAPITEAIRYEIDVTSVAGMRLVGDVLEFLDPGGAPRLRVKRPWLLDARGEIVYAQLEVVPGDHGGDCVVDRSPAPPWGRPPIPPCSRGLQAARESMDACRCEVRVSWEGRGVVYPALLDPAWSSTKSMAEARNGPALSPLQENRIMVIGGNPEGPSAASATTEIFDPTTETWSMGPTMNEPRDDASVSALPHGRVLVAAGRVDANNTTNSAELYDPITHSWDYTAPIQTFRLLSSATRMLDDRVLVAGGLTFGADSVGPATTNVRIFDPVTESWQQAPPMGAARKYHTATLTPEGRVVVVGGASNDGSAHASVEQYDPDTGQWSPLPSLGEARKMHTAVLLPDESILVCGGFGPDDVVLATCEVLPKEKNQWIQGPTMLSSRRSHTASRMTGGGVLVAGGANANGRLASTEVLLPGAAAWLDAGNMSGLRSWHAASTLATGKVLVAGGNDGPNDLASAELFTLLPGGSPCLVSGACESGLCAAGVCCDQPCSGPCYACTNADKGGGLDGVCGNVPGSPCAPFECQDLSEGGSCKSSCAADDDCATGFACNEQSGLCTAAGEWYCVDHIKKQANDDTPPEDCFPFSCDAGACVSVCELNDDCAKGASCTAGGNCASISAAVEAPAGCGCKVGGASSKTPVLPIIATVLTVIVMHWRRSRELRDMAKRSPR